MHWGLLIWLAALGLVAWAAKTPEASDLLVFLGIPGLLVTMPFVFGVYRERGNK